MIKIWRKYEWHFMVEVATYIVVEVKRPRIVKQRMIVVGCFLFDFLPNKISTVPLDKVETQRVRGTQ